MHSALYFSQQNVPTSCKFVIRDLNRTTHVAIAPGYSWQLTHYCLTRNEFTPIKTGKIRQCRYSNPAPLGHTIDEYIISLYLLDNIIYQGGT